jgi:hypothetical protein
MDKLVMNDHFFHTLIDNLYDGVYFVEEITPIPVIAGPAPPVAVSLLMLYN